MGLNDIKQESVFRWINNAPLNYPDRWSTLGNWGQPNGGTNQNCVVLDMIQVVGNYQDKDCTENNEILCSDIGIIKNEMI